VLLARQLLLELFRRLAAATMRALSDETERLAAMHA
jgi:hypothetical protein